MINAGRPSAASALRAAASSTSSARPARLAAAAPTTRGRRRSVAVSAADAPHALITGSNTGIGLETAKALASKGYAVTLACRDDAKAAAAAAAVQQHAGPACPDVSTLRLDLASLSSVRDAANTLLDSGKRLDVLVNNAGVMAPPDRLTTSDGFELQVGVNHLGHFAFTARIWPALRRRESPAAAAAAGLPPAIAKRLVVVSSSAHLIPGMDLDDLNWTKRKYSAWGAYGSSKLANVLFAYELARRLPSPAASSSSSSDGAAPVAVNALMPGVVRTELSRYIMPNRESLQARALALLTLPFTLDPVAGAQTSIRLASDPELEGITAKYFDVYRNGGKPGGQPVTSAGTPNSYDEQAAAKLWAWSEEQTGVAFEV